MSLLIFCAVVIIILILALWLIRSAPIGDATLKWVLQAISVVLAILVILNRSGMV